MNKTFLVKFSALSKQKCSFTNYERLRTSIFCFINVERTTRVFNKQNLKQKTNEPALFNAYNTRNTHIIYNM